MALAEQTTGPAEHLSIADVAERTGLSAHTLRYYERIGLFEVERNGSGHRQYAEPDLARIRFITCLRLTAMPIRDIQAYVAMANEGLGTEPDRLSLPERHRDQVAQQFDDLQTALDAIEFKIAAYGGGCSATSPDTERTRP